MKTKLTWNYCAALLLVTLLAACSGGTQRRVVSLNGEWQMAKTTGELPSEFGSVAPVPGLVDMAVPALDSAATLYKEGWYWYKREFTLPNINYAVIDLKVFKAKYHTKVYVNGQFVGENYYCFTPSYYDLKPFLNTKNGRNEIMIGVGCKDQLPDTIPDGTDYEKLKYIPGIYDNVEITLSNKPYIENVQCAPDVEGEKLRVVTEIETDLPNAPLKINYRVRELASKKSVTESDLTSDVSAENGMVKVDFTIDMKGATLWTPENPFLYELILNTGADTKTIRFGMRSLRFDPEKKVAILNGKPYYLRGTNVCIFRFFEDPERGNLPWDDQWPVTLHERFKDMGWGMMRYCIGFPPERWYDICDSLGIMLQDEYPIWAIKPDVKAPQIAGEYERWMRERWNHPSVVVWDAQNELVTQETGLAIQQVRGLDLSGRPWENGWSEPQADTDPCESHPYLFLKYLDPATKEPTEGYKKELFGKVSRAAGDANDFSEKRLKNGELFKSPSLINEYGWIWLNRDGSPTTLTDRIYDYLWDGTNLTPEQRKVIYARHLAMLTEYWRAHRQAAGILHFCGLGYSRPAAPRGQTSDHWIDLRNLTYEPNFYTYVKPAFAPVGLMVDLWEKEYKAGSTLQVPVYVTNDLDVAFADEIKVLLKQGDQVVATLSKTDVSVEPYTGSIVPFELTLPLEKGEYQLQAEIVCQGEQVFSLRDIPIK